MTTRRTLLQALLYSTLVGLFVTADVVRTADVPTATSLSMLGWATFLCFTVVWFEGGRGWLSFVRVAGELLLVATVAGGVLGIYYARSGILSAGVHVDSVYSYLGLQQFLDLDNPITFAGSTCSYNQFPLTLLQHLPARAVGFDRLGPFAVHLGVMLQVALLIAAIARVFLPGRFGMQLAIAALVAAVFSNRMLVLAYDHVGYAIPAICLGLLFVVLVDEDSVPVPDRVAGGLVSLSLLHYYTGALFVLPVCLAGLLIKREPLRRASTFFRTNSVLIAVMTIAAITSSIHPELLLARVRDVTIQTKDIVPGVIERVRENSNALVPFYRDDWLHLFVIGGRGSWFLLDMPPLGGAVIPLVCATWALSAWTLREGRARYARALTGFIVALVALTVVQHLLTDFYEYRDLTAIYALIVSGLLFVFRAPRLGVRRGLIAVLCAAAIGAYNYSDLANLHGRVHVVPGHDPVSRETMEALRHYLAANDVRATMDVGTVYVAVADYFPVGMVYADALRRRYGVEIVELAAPEACADLSALRALVSRAGCRPFLLVADARLCPAWDSDDVRGPIARRSATLFGGTCDGAAVPAERRPHVTVSLG